MAFARPKKREPVGEAGLFDFAVGTLARRMRTVRDLRRLMKARAEEGEEGERAMDAVIVRLKELNYLSDTRFAEDYTRVRKEHEKFGKRRVQQELMMKGVGKELVASTLETAYEDVDEVVGDAGAHLKRSVEPAEEAGEALALQLDDEPVTDKFDRGGVEELLRALEGHRRLAAVDRRDIDIGGGDLDLEPDRPRRGEGLHRYSFQLRP